MKKIYAFIAAAAFTTGAFAQNLSQPAVNKKKMTVEKNTVDRSNQRSQATNNFYIDYDLSDESAAISSGLEYTRYIWQVKSNAGTTEAGVMKNVTVAFDSLYDSSNEIGYNQNTVTTIRVDTIFAWFGHENNSGTANRIIAKIVPLNTAGYPQIGTVLWADTITTTTGLSSGNDWLGDQVVAYFTPNYTGTMSNFGVYLTFEGAATDTFGLLSGFADAGPCGTSDSRAVPSVFTEPNANSYATWATYNLMLPTSTNQDVYYDCNSSGTPDAGDGANYMQNHAIWVNVTTDPAPTGLNENQNAFAVSQNQPNPFKTNSSIKYQIPSASDVTISVYDVTGKLVIEQKEGLQDAGKHAATIDATKLASGIYYYTLKAGSNSATSKMAVVK